MLLTLSVRDFVVVESLELDFGPGFTVLTGETGAGKSILIDALQLALGERADSGVIRDGAQRAEVAAEFRVDPRSADWLAQAGLGCEGDIALVRRTVDGAGRSRAFINGTAVTLAQLRELGEGLVDIWDDRGARYSAGPVQGAGGPGWSETSIEVIPALDPAAGALGVRLSDLPRSGPLATVQCSPVSHDSPIFSSTR